MRPRVPPTPEKPAKFADFGKRHAADPWRIVLALRMHSIGLMHAADLVELAALISAETPTMFQRGSRLSSAGADAYWTASKCRFERWSRQLKTGRDERNRQAAHGDHPAGFATCLEILTSEVLTRVWAAAAIAADGRSESSELAPVAQSILFGHHEARVNVLNLIAAHLQGKPGRHQQQAQRLDRVRRVSERWTDLLLAPLAEYCPPETVAHDPARVRDFAEDRIDEGDLPTAGRARALLSASLRTAFQRFSTWPSRNADLNSQIASAVLSCFDIDSLALSGGPLGGPTHSWLLFARLATATTDTERLVNDLLALERTLPQNS
jgi:hypothetical protein